MDDLLDSPATVNQSGISGWIDGLFGEGATGNITGAITGVAQQYGQNWLAEQFPEQYPPQDYVNGSTGSPVDNAVAEQQASNPDMAGTYIKYGAYGLAAIAGISVLVYALRG